MISQRSLEAFQAVMDAGTVSGAADTLHVSQPAVSRLIKDLEIRTGLQLFTRMGGKIIPTPEAHEMVIEVEHSFIGLAAIEEAAREILQGRRGTVSVASMPALAHSILPDTLVELRAQRPDFRINIHSMQTHNVIRQVASRQCQMGFTSPTRHEFDVDLVQTHDVPYYCILPAKHPLAELSSIGLTDLAAQDFVGFSESTATGRMLDRHFARLKTPPLISIRSHLSTILSAMVLRGLGVSIVDAFTAKVHEANGGLMRPVNLQERFRFAIIRPRGHRLGADLEELLEIFEARIMA